jgi:polysaccharide biosynthesis protein PslG
MAILWILIVVVAWSSQMARIAAQTAEPTETAIPTLAETPIPAATVTPTPEISATPSETPTETPTDIPVESPTVMPTETPTLAPVTETPTLAPTNTPGLSAFAIGVTINTVNPQAVQAARDAGARWVRLDASWKTIEAQKGTRDFSALDPQIDALTGFQILLTVSTAPDWARTSLDENGPPNNFNDFHAFMGDVANRYKGKVQAYEVWSEPNLRRNWNGQPLSASGYVKLLRGASQAIRKADPAALVISAGLSPTGFNDGRNAIDDRVFLREMYKAGVKTVADGIGAHPFGWGNPADALCCKAAEGVNGWYDARSFYFRETLTDYFQIMAETGDYNRKLWVTAFGWGAVDGVADPATVNEGRFGFVKFLDQAKQAQYTADALRLGRLSGFVGPMFATSLNGCTPNADPASSDFYLCYYSLLDSAGNGRPVFEAFRNAAR